MSGVEPSLRGTVAYCTVPKIGGTFNYFRNLRQALVPMGWRVLAPTVGRHLNNLWDEAFADEDCFRLAGDVDDPKQQARQLVDWLNERRVDFLIPMSTPAAVAAIPHLPTSIIPVYRCSNITRHAYDIVTEHLQYVPRVIATSRRQWDDLRTRRHVPESKLVLIPHGTDTTAFEVAYRLREMQDGGPIRLGYLGRLLDSAKGIFLLPSVLGYLERARVEHTLTIIGDGPDRPRLEERLEGNTHVRWLGNQPNDRIPELLSQMDILLMPSRFEGFGFSLIEAMTAGVVPVVSRIRGVTDWVVDDETSGFVCPIGDASEFADRVARLASDRALLRSMSEQTHGQAVERFGLKRLGDSYHELLTNLRDESAPRPRPVDWSQFRPARGFEPTFRRWIPESWKGRVRGWLERWGIGS
jgi:glycosyltransferase involved in cell wall biosynthesis